MSKQEQPKREFLVEGQEKLAEPLEPFAPSNLPLSHLVRPLVAQGIEGSQRKQHDADELEKVIQRTRNGQVRVRTFSRQNTIMVITLLVLAVVTLYTMIVLDYGKVHFGEAVNKAINDFFAMMLQPSLEPHLDMGRVFLGVLVSLALSVLTTFIGAVVAFILGLLASANLSPRGLSNVIKAVMSFFRAVPTILWVLVFTVAIGLGPEAAICGLLFHSVAYLVKAYSERFEEVDRAVIDALRSTGASWWQVVFQAVVPQTMSELLSWTFIRFEINFVNAVAVGAVAGVGGIGYELSQAGTFYHNIHEVGAIVYACLLVAVILEVLATQLRKRYIR